LKITAVSVCCVDVYPELDTVYVGGNSLNFATQCRLSGITNVSVIGAVGNDSYGTLIENHLDSISIDRTRLYSIDTSTASNKIFINEKGDRYFKADSWYGGAFDVFRLAPNDWKFLESSDIVAMPAGDPNLDELLKKRNDKQLVVIDFMDYLELSFVEKKIENIDISFISIQEEKLEDLYALANRTGKMIVATLGAKGSVAFWNKKSYHQDAIEATKIVDTTGCGDAFQAAFSINWLQSRDIKKALLTGAMAAKRVLTFIGGVG